MLGLPLFAPPNGPAGDDTVLPGTILLETGSCGTRALEVTPPVEVPTVDNLPGCGPIVLGTLTGIMSKDPCGTVEAFPVTTANWLGAAVLGKPVCKKRSNDFICIIVIHRMQLTTNDGRIG